MKKTQSIICIVTILALLLFSNCQKQDYPNNPVQLFEKSDSIMPEKELALDCLFIASFTDMQWNNDYLILLDVKQENHFMSVVNIEEEQIVGKGVKKGKGPGEFGHLSEMHRGLKPGVVEFYDKTFMQYSRIVIDSLLQSFESASKIITFNHKVPRLYSVMRMGKGHYVGSGSSKKGRFIHIESKGGKIQQVNHLYDYPEDKHPDLSREIKALAYQLYFTKQPGGNYFMSATNNGALLDFFTFKNEEINRIKSIVFYLPDYKVIDTEYAKAAPKNGDSKMGFIDLASNKDYVFVVYSGKTIIETYLEDGLSQGKHVLVFNWKGKAIKHLKLARAAAMIAVSADSKKLYVAETKPTKIMEYSLNL